MRLLPLIAAFLALGGLGACSPHAPALPFEIVIHVESDPGVPLPGATIVRDGKDVSATGADGRAKLALRGNEGDSADLFVRCPQGFQSPPKPITASLRRIANDAKHPPYAVACPPLERKVVVAVRAENGPNLPVLYLGKEMARTDAAGAAHLLLSVRPGDQFEISLGTTERGNERLRPQNPTVAFVVKAHDDIMTFDQRFAFERRPVDPRPLNRPRPL